MRGRVKYIALESQLQQVEEGGKGKTWPAAPQGPSVPTN